MSNLGITQYNEFVPQKQTKVQVSNKKDNDGIFTDFCDKEWSGKTVAKLTGDNIFTDCEMMEKMTEVYLLKKVLSV